MFIVLRLLTVAAPSFWILPVGEFVPVFYELPVFDAPDIDVRI